MFYSFVDDDDDDNGIIDVQVGARSVGQDRIVIQFTLIYKNHFGPS
jgi:hypothetical protein